MAAAGYSESPHDERNRRVHQRVASSSQTFPVCPSVTSLPVLYGVGAGDSAGDSAGDGEGISDAEPSVFGGFLFAPEALCRVRDGVGVGLATAGAVVVVAVVPCC